MLQLELGEAVSDKIKCNHCGEEKDLKEIEKVTLMSYSNALCRSCNWDLREEVLKLAEKYLKED